MQETCITVWERDFRFGPGRLYGRLSGMDSRVVKPHTPVRLVVASVLIGLIVLGFIFFAVFQSGRGITEARLRGTVVAKEFTPQAERQIILGRDGGVDARDREGEFLLKVEVKQEDGSVKTYDVWIQTRQQYDAIKVGDSFDVGPYLVK